MLNMDDAASHLDVDQHNQSDHHEQDTTAPVLNERTKKSTGKPFRRLFVFLHKGLDSVPQKSRLESLQQDGQIQEVAFKGDTLPEK